LHAQFARDLRDPARGARPLAGRESRPRAAVWAAGAAGCATTVTTGQDSYIGPDAGAAALPAVHLVRFAFPRGGE
jgi:hypothetical protein